MSERSVDSSEGVVRDSKAFRAVVLTHFKHPKNRGALPGATVSVAGANPLCGDRIRIELRVEGDAIVDARFTADACAITIATASVVTDGVRGKTLRDLAMFDSAWVERALDGPPPSARTRCVTLVIDTLRRAAEAMSR